MKKMRMKLKGKNDGLLKKEKKSKARMKEEML